MRTRISLLIISILLGSNLSHAVDSNSIIEDLVNVYMTHKSYKRQIVKYKSQQGIKYNPQNLLSIKDLINNNYSTIEFNKDFGLYYIRFAPESHSLGYFLLVYKDAYKVYDVSATGRFFLLKQMLTVNNDGIVDKALIEKALQQVIREQDRYDGLNIITKQRKIGNITIEIPFD